MTAVHVVAGCVLVALNLAAGLLGGISWLRHRTSIRFWYLLRFAQLSVLIEILIGGVLLAAGQHSGDSLHYLYGLLPLPVSFLAEGARAGAANQEIGDRDFDSMPADDQRAIALAIVRREMGIMTVSCLVIFFLALRAAGTA